MTQPFTDYSQGLSVTPLGTISIPADTTGSATYTPITELVPPAILGWIGDVQSIWVDASNSLDPVTIRNPQTRLYQTWPPGTIGWQVLLVKSGAMQLEAYCFSATTITMAVANVPLNSFIAQAGVVKSSVYSSVSRVNAAAASTSLLTANAERQGFSIYNDSAARCYLLLNDGVASSTNFTVILEPYAYFESPYAYGGVVRGRWTSATGAAQITEYF